MDSAGKKEHFKSHSCGPDLHYLCAFFFFSSASTSPHLLEIPHHRPKPLYVPVTRNNESTFCTRDQYLAPRVAFISWLVTFFLEKKYVNSAAAAQSTKNGTEVIPKLIQVSQAGGFAKSLVTFDVFGLFDSVFFAWNVLFKLQRLLE